MSALTYTGAVMTLLLGSLWIVLRTCLPGEEKVITSAFRRRKP